MNIDNEQLGIPDTKYKNTVSMSSAEFQRICRDMLTLNESGKNLLIKYIVDIEVTKNEIKFKAEGELGNGCVTLKSGIASIDDVIHNLILGR